MDPPKSNLPLDPINEPLLSPSVLKLNLFYDIPFEIPENVEEEGKIVKILAYKVDILKTLLYVIFSLVTGGFYYLLCKWYLKLKIRSTLRMVPIEKATYLLIFCQDESFDLIQTKMETFSLENNGPAPNAQNQPLVLQISSQNKSYKTFEYRLFKYYFDDILKRFMPIRFSLTNLTNFQIHEIYGLKDQESYQEKKALYGLNSTEIPEKPIVQILVDEILSPFYLFQIFSCILWFYDQYEIYAAVILATTVISILLTLWDAYHNMKNLRKMSYYETPVKVYRGFHDYMDTSSKEKTNISPEIMTFQKTISSLELIPGDLVEVPENCVIPCDLILLNGSCIMNECMLTGESIPVLKNALPYNNLIFNPNDENKSSILFSGTKCIETRYFLKGKIPVLATVAQTGFNTMKGQLVRSILFPKNNAFQFYKDSLKFIGAMSCIAVLGFIWSLVSLLGNDDDTQDIILKCLDMITVTVPPALPACMTVGIQFALTRLKKKQIYCISPLKINISGKVNVMCFDKTGTLTEEGLDTYGVRPVINKEPNSQKNSFGPLKKVLDLNDALAYNRPKEILAMLKPEKHESNVTNKSLVSQKNLNRKFMSNEELLLEGLASCHSLTSVAGSLIGDPLDIKMFESTGWLLEDNNENKFDELVLAVVKPAKKDINSVLHVPNDFDSVAQSLIHNDMPNEIGIIRRFEFSSKLQRMSVIVKNLSENSFRLHIKGSPEKLRELCVKESIPSNFHKILDNYSKNGFRVLACATRQLQVSFKNVHKFEREQFEKDAVFLGFLIMENKLKDVTRSIIDQLQQANVRTIMVTGDNALTAISVARQCHIVNPKQRVYLGDLSEKPINGKYKLVWKDFDFSEHELNPETLKPIDDISEYDEEHKEDELEIQESDGESFEENKETGTKEPYSNKDPQSYTVHINNNNSYAEVIPQQMNSLQEKQLIAKKHKTKPKFNKTEIIKNLNEACSAPLPRKLTNSLVAGTQEKIMRKKQKIKKFKIESLIEEENPPWLSSETDTYALALTGRAFSHYMSLQVAGVNNVNFQKMLEKAQVFARMKPAEKATMVQSFQQYTKNALVGMCGDGANDCGALKTADVGVSLSEAEASIAAPFTSKIQDISCIVKLLREGRCALSTSFQCFKYMALYSMIQFASVVMLYDSFSNLSDNQFLWIDLILIFPLAILMCYTKSNKTLSTDMPTANLISFPVLSSVIGQIIIQFGFQVFI